MRNGTLLEWSDTLCILIDQAEAKRAENIFLQHLAATGLKFSYFFKDNIHGLKVFPTDSPLVPRTFFAFDSIDVMYYQRAVGPRGGSILQYEPILTTKEYSAGNAKQHNFPLDEIYPTIEVDLHGSRVFVPAQAAKVVANLYGPSYMTRCESARWDRRWDQWAGGTAGILETPCRDLMTMYPFADSWARALGVPGHGAQV